MGKVIRRKSIAAKKPVARSKRRPPSSFTRPFQKNDEAVLRSDVLQRHAQSVPPQLGYTREQFRWREILSDIGNRKGLIERNFEGSDNVNVDFNSPKYKGTLQINERDLVRPGTKEVKVKVLPPNTPGNSLKSRYKIVAMEGDKEIFSDTANSKSFANSRKKAWELRYARESKEQR